MKQSIGLGIVGALALAAGANAAPLFQFDLNGFTATTSGGTFGANYTGSINISRGSGALEAVAILPQGFGGPTQSFVPNSPLSSFTGVINLVNGNVTGGNLSVVLANGNQYTTSIGSFGNAVGSQAGGAFTITANTFNGAFSGSTFGGVNVSQWFANQGPGLPGSFLQFRFSPNSGGTTADMDLFVDVVPLPPAAWTGLATLAGVVAFRRLRRR